ncbi:2OG-Fe dioxygenase family protein [Acetobacteraceae bacterium ESL0709]|nr:2OG-Fe dioxygenase family protein [Acetobacteraceae bacterium ESL0697]MDF7677584.1 2OG-Fe dioxygenase family protein [Acetobacteraceae bacterium ESL0709]
MSLTSLLSRSPDVASALEELKQHDFAFLPASRAEAFYKLAGLKDWDGFAKSWNDLGLDRYMADGGRYRRRRYATYSVTKSEITRKAHQPHYQSRDYNLLNGGIERWFSPVKEAIGEHPALLAIIRDGAFLADRLVPESHKPPTSWHCEIHQFRIEAASGKVARPTPEGMHRDGVDLVLVVMIHRQNIKEGTTTIHALDKKTLLGSFTLAQPLDTAIVNDHKVYHGVTNVEPKDPEKPAYRDVLVVTLRHE